MKQKSLVILLGCESVMLTALAILTNFFPTIFSSIPAFPFEQIAEGLRLLSQIGSIGNGLAIALWVGVSLIPTILALKIGRNKETAKERIALFLLSAVMMLALYGMVNPGLFCPTLLDGQKEFIPVIKATLGITIWSVVVLYVIFRLLRMFIGGDTNKLMQYLKVLLYILCIFFTAIIFTVCISELIVYQKDAQEVLAVVFSVIRFLVLSVPYVFDVVITISAIALLDVALSKEQSGIVESAAKLSQRCCIALGITAASTTVFNILQIVIMRHLPNITVNVDVPIVSIAFTLIVLLVSRLLIENKRLRDDNDLFI